MEDTVQEALFEIVLFQLFSSATGITQLKEKWSDYKQPRRPRRLASLFVSEEGHYVAVASRNQITILQKDDDYQESAGTFQCDSMGKFKSAMRFAVLVAVSVELAVKIATYYDKHKK